MLPTLSTDVIPKNYKGGPSCLIPIKWLVNLHNSIPRASNARQEIKDYLTAFAAMNKKAHGVRALAVEENGDLRFDEALYDQAVYRGKQETRLNSASEIFNKLKDELDLLQEFQKTEAAAALASELSKESRLVPLPDYSPNLAHIKNSGHNIAQLVDRMRCGLANNIANTIDTNDMPD